MDAQINEEKNDKSPLHYIAIGASAGGLEALQELVRQLPVNGGMAFIVVQHLSPHFKSVMDELLRRYTSLQVMNVLDGVEVEADTIYLIPPRKNMMIAEGKLILVDQMPKHSASFPIDIFFRSLAEDQLHRSVGVILSGTGSDGSRGIQAIKEVGGLVIVQDPEDAKFDGMPLSALKTGVVDFVAPADKLANRLVKVLSHPLVSGEKSSLATEIDGAEDALHEIYELLRTKSNIDFSQYKGSTVSRRIERRIGIHGLDSIQSYYRFLVQNPHELSILSKDMLIGVTRFFRDAEVFDELKKTVVPNIIDSNPVGEPIRIWIAGCSSGEEAYSVAILFDECMRDRGETRVIKIFATDVDSDAIAEASAGQFNLNILADVGEDLINRYFVKSEDCFTISSAIRQMVVFATHNLLRDPPFSNCQLVLCRNVLIYFQPKAQKNILSMLQFAMKKNGFLCLGTSETLGESANQFSVINERARVYQKKHDNRTAVGAMLAPTMTEARSNSRAPSLEYLVKNYQQHHKAPGYMPVLEHLINAFVPACIILSEDLDVLHIYGDVSPYTSKLRSGRFSAKVGDYLIDSLSVAATTAIRKSATDKATVRYSGIKFKDANGDEAQLDLEVFHIDSTTSLLSYLALVFNPNVTVTADRPAESVQYDLTDEAHQRIQDLEEALRKNQENLQVTVEELETANEELQSSNEELMAANEELQSTNEELQSVNEELYTVNSEYQEKIEEISKINMDLDNIIKSAAIGFIFLDDALLVRRFSPVATRYFNLLESDVGRPFHHISHLLYYDSLLNDVASVTEAGKSTEKEVLSKPGTQILVKISPYLDEVGEASGCVISLTDVSEMRTLKSSLQESYSELRSTVETAFWQEFQQVNILIVDDDKADRLSIVSAIKQISSRQVDFDIIESSSFDEALNCLKNGFYDVCFIDNNLGDKSGLELVEMLDKERGMPAFIMLTGHTDKALSEQASRLGFYDIIDKNDITPALLERSIRYTQRHQKTERYLLEKIDS